MRLTLVSGIELPAIQNPGYSSPSGLHSGRIGSVSYLARNSVHLDLPSRQSI